MSEIRVKVPEGMLKAACAANDEYSDEGTNRRVLESALRWLSENPIVPTADDVGKILAARSVQGDFPDAGYLAIYVASQWQRRMFVAPDEDEAIRDLLHGPTDLYMRGEDYNYQIREAYRRGRKDSR